LGKDAPIPLDGNRLFFLSVYRNENGEIEKYSIDIEKASDSHYELSINAIKQLENYLSNKFPKRDLFDGLKEFLRTNNESDLTNLFDSLETKLQPVPF